MRDLGTTREVLQKMAQNLEDMPALDTLMEEGFTVEFYSAKTEILCTLSKTNGRTVVGRGNTSLAALIAAGLLLKPCP